MRYTLYSGAGNTFALVEERLSPSQAHALCEACSVDGAIFPEFRENKIWMRTFNRDGSEAEMCGNGLRCFIKFLQQLGVDQENYLIETPSGAQKAWIRAQNVCVELAPPRDFRWNLEIEGRRVHHIDTGVPHAILFVDSVENEDLETLGPRIRNHPLFPKGANVNIVEPDTLRLRTYERGVERETKACGTGATASALAVAKFFKHPSPLLMKVRSGALLKISFNPDWSSLTMEGPAEQVDEGTFSFNYRSPILAPS